MPKIRVIIKNTLSGAALSSALMMVAAVTAHATELSAEGIAGTGIQGIAGTGIQGIAGTGIQGIAGTGIQGIAGTGIQGIAGTGIQGIAGTGIQGIAGTGIQGIAGTGIQGIAGTGIQGIAGTGIQGIAGTGIEGIAGTGIESGAGLPVVALGPVEEVLDNGYRILGQSVVDVNHFHDSPLNVGDTAMVFGLVSEGALFANQVVQLTGASIDGSSLVFIAGIVDEADSMDGGFTLGELKIQIGSAGADPESFNIQAGHFVEVLGFHFDGLLIAESIYDGGLVIF